MSDQPKAKPDPSAQALWKEEVSFREADEAYVSRRQFGKFLVLTSFGMLAGNAWIVVRSLLKKAVRYPVVKIARADEIPIGGVKTFGYPGPDDPCILVRPDQHTYVAYDQKCTHLSCAVVYAEKRGQLECPCHHGFFSVRTGAVLQGPPPRALPRIRLERRGDDLVAIGISQGDADDEGQG